ncbi:hypothetical protein AABB24_021410 [Solanum stoloniferum]|uniref:MSP domain-containing protein n=1 Tax=Solanum stoloniferum TaxID=62892 RepID=A0ABD2SV46_9SOLN
MEPSKYESEVSLTRNPQDSQETNIAPKKAKSRSGPLKIQLRPLLSLKYFPKSNGTVEIPIQASEPKMLIKVNPKTKIFQISNFGPQIYNKTPNLKLTTLLSPFPHFGTDEIECISFQDSKLQKTQKNVVINFSVLKFYSFHNSQLLTQSLKQI